MLEVGRLCVKLAGRDAGNYCVVVAKLDENYVLIDGDVRRRKCNIMHLHPQKKKLEIKENATTKEVEAAFKKEKLKISKSGYKQPVKKSATKEVPKAQKKAVAAEAPVTKKKPAKKPVTKKKPVKKK